MKRIACAAGLVAVLAPLGAYAGKNVPAGLVAQAKANGLTRCTDTLAKLERRLVDDHEHAFLLNMDDTHADDHLFEAMVIKSYDGTDSQIRITVRANAKGRCEWSYTETSVEEQGCETLAKALADDRPLMRFANRSLVISGEPKPDDTAVAVARAVTLSGDPVDLFLTPSARGKACIVTQREAALGEDVGEIVEF